jgi:tRNA pseudouridine38-40 synthase
MDEGRPSVTNTRLVIEYDGSEFCGWQKQPRVRTVEAELLRALEPLVGPEVEMIAAARTDSGVHALAQVANFTSVSQVSPAEMEAALNASLPPDVRILGATEAPLTFNARYDARCRHYRYLVSTRPTALWRRHRWCVKWKLDLDAINRACSCLVGEHDFSAFTCKEETRSPRIAMSAAFAEEVEPGVVAVSFVAERFLRKMVRTLVGTLVEVGRARMLPAEACDILSSRERKRAGPCAPPQGLYLVRVEY